MTTRNRNTIVWTIAIAAMAILVLTATSANAAVVVTPGHIVSGSVTGTLIAIDTPYQSTIPVSGPLGPSWPENADDGWWMNSGSNLEADHGQSPWEPDGTLLAQARTYRLNSAPGSSYTFNLADSGIDLPDDSVINGVYATWLTRGVSGANWSYTEGAASDTNSRTMTSAPNADLVLQWTDSVLGTHNGNFERLFTGPITVTGGDGFTLNAVRTGNTHQADAVVLDVTIIPEPSTLALAALGLLGLLGWRRRRRR